MKFSAEYEVTKTLEVELARAHRHFSDLEAVAKNTRDVEFWKVHDPRKLELRFREQSGQGIKFHGQYVVGYEVDDTNIRWRTIESPNMWLTGHITLTSLGPRACSLAYREHLELDMNTSVMLGTVARPFIQREIRRGMRDFVESMCQSLLSTPGSTP